MKDAHFRLDSNSIFFIMNICVKTLMITIRLDV